MSKDKQMIDETTAQTVGNSEKSAKKAENVTVSDATAKPEIKAEKVVEKPKTANEKVADKAPEKATAKNETAPVVVKKGGSAIGLLALLVALGIGGAGYYFGTQQFSQVQAELDALKAKSNQIQTAAGSVEIPNFDAEKAQLAELSEAYKTAQQKIADLSHEQTVYHNQINALNSQIQRLGNATPQVDNSAWALSDADFLLNNAVRKLVLDNDVDTAKSLLQEADNALSRVLSPEAAAVRQAIKEDLASLNSVNQVDQNGLMLRLTNLANRLDDLPLVENEASDSASNNTEVSDSIDDWQKNIEKSASSFLDHFIRVSDKNRADEKAFVAPNQEIYLRENIRLRLQIAILAIPRQQNELYQKSLDAVSSWVRSYFDTKNENVKNFLKELDELSDQSIYVDAPEQLKSLTLLDAMLKKAPQKVEKIELKEEKALVEPVVEPVAEPAKPEAEKAEPATQSEQPAEAKPAENAQ